MATIKKAPSAKLIIGVVFSTIGLLFAVIGIAIGISFSDFSAKAESTTAEITRIETYTKSSNGSLTTYHDVYVKYSVDGVTYNVLLDYFDSSMYVGGTVEVLYNPDNPAEIKGNDITITFIFTGMGIVFLIIGLLVGVIPYTKEVKRKKLIETGEQATGVITNVIVDRSVEINGRHPYKAECEVIDPITGERYLYSSQTVMNDISYLIGQSIAVYYNPDNRGEYYVDLDSVHDDVLGGAPEVHDFR